MESNPISARVLEGFTFSTDKSSSVILHIRSAIVSPVIISSNFLSFNVSVKIQVEICFHIESFPFEVSQRFARLIYPPFLTHSVALYLQNKMQPTGLIAFPKPFSSIVTAFFALENRHRRMFFRLFATYCNGDAEDLKANLKKSIVDKIPHIKILRRHLTFFAWRGMIYIIILEKL